MFIVGAGISMDPPSSLPSAFQFIRCIMEHFAPKEEAARLATLPGLRFEKVMESLKEEVPSQYRREVERYFRGLTE